MVVLATVAAVIIAGINLWLVATSHWRRLGVITVAGIAGAALSALMCQLVLDAATSDVLETAFDGTLSERRLRPGLRRSRSTSPGNPLHRRPPRRGEPGSIRSHQERSTLPHPNRVKDSAPTATRPGPAAVTLNICCAPSPPKTARSWGTRNQVIPSVEIHTAASKSLPGPLQADCHHSRTSGGHAQHLLDIVPAEDLLNVRDSGPGRRGYGRRSPLPPEGEPTRTP